MSPDSPDGDPIRVLAFLDDTVVSGNVKPVLALARYARKGAAALRPLDLSMLTFVRAETDPELVRTLREEGFAIDVVRERRRFDFGVFPQLRAIIQRRRPHVLWTHGAKTHFLVRVAGLHHKGAWIAFHHGYTATSLAWKMYDQLDRWSLRGADRVMTACEAFATDLNGRLGIRRERLSVHRSPLAAGPSQTGRSDAGPIVRGLGLPSEARIVLSVGRLSKEKGHAELIRAMPDVIGHCDFPVALLIVGDGPEQSRLERLCARLGLTEHVRFLGYRPDVSPYYAAADVFALTSHSEGSPNVLLEAMDAGVPIVATAVGGVGEMIRNGEQGLLVRRGDVEEITHGIVTLLSNAELRGTLTSAARESLAAYSLERYYASVHSVFKALAPSR
jgi:glycosyltransferase involved in cell wall biosynthesis